MENPSIKDLFYTLCHKLSKKPEMGFIVIGLYVPICKIVYHKNCSIIFNDSLFKDLNDDRKTQGILIYPGKLTLRATHDDAMSDNGDEIKPYEAHLIIGEDEKSYKKFLTVQYNDDQEKILLDEDEQEMILDIILSQCIISGKLPWKGTT